MKLKITCGLLALAGTSFGALISLSSVGANYNGTDDYGILLSNGTPVAPSAGVARVGVFTTLSDVQVSTLAGSQDYATLFAPGNFTSLASDDFTGIASAFGPTPGFISISASGINAAGLNNTLYVYFESGTELGLFKTNSTIVPDLAQPAPPSNYFLYFTEGTPLIGGFGPDYLVDFSNISGSPGNVAVNSFQLINTAPIPEPSAALLGALGALGLLRRRRI